jgi:DNA invertase Pin-like site-specific DNA recombinase
MLTVLGGLAEFERHLILARTTEEALARRANDEALVDIGRSYNVSHSTISPARLTQPLRQSFALHRGCR